VKPAGLNVFMRMSVEIFDCGGEHIDGDKSCDTLSLSIVCRRSTLFQF